MKGITRDEQSWEKGREKRVGEKDRPAMGNTPRAALEGWQQPRWPRLIRDDFHPAQVPPVVGKLEWSRQRQPAETQVKLTASSSVGHGTASGPGGQSGSGLG